MVATGPPDERSGNECAWRAVGRSLGLATVGLVAIWLAASGGGDDADRSDGFERFKEDGVSISYPESWRELPDPEGDQSVVLLAREVGRPAVEAAQVTLTRVDEEAPFSSLMLVTDYEPPADGRRIPYRARQIIALKAPDLQLNVG